MIRHVEGRIAAVPNHRTVLRSYTLGPAQLALGTGVSQYGRVAIENGRIAAVIEGEGPSDFHPPAGATIAPGMIDVHTNGADDVLFNRSRMRRKARRDSSRRS